MEVLNNIIITDKIMAIAAIVLYFAIIGLCLTIKPCKHDYNDSNL